MTSDQVEAAIEWAYEFAEQWLIGPPGGLAGYELHRIQEFLRTQSPARARSVENPGSSEIPAGSPSQEVGYVYDDSKGERLIANALKGDADADAVLCSFAAEFIRGGCLFPERLREYIADQLSDRAGAVVRKRGRKKHTNNHRNYYIQEAVAGLIERGFSATRNAATESVSACSIVSQALERQGVHLSEHGVAKVWKQRPIEW
jgi:hypothetical protein